MQKITGKIGDQDGKKMVLEFAVVNSGSNDIGCKY